MHPRSTQPEAPRPDVFIRVAQYFPRILPRPGSSTLLVSRLEVFSCSAKRVARRFVAERNEPVLSGGDFDEGLADTDELTASSPGPGPRF